MSDQMPQPQAHESGMRLTLPMLAQRLGDYQTIFLERMKLIQEYIESIEKTKDEEIAALKAENEELQRKVASHSEHATRIAQLEKSLASLVLRTSALK